ncbi:MAG TPA: MFS transporter [Ktedonosporobacter sp.]|nr:MFS transporter [Ktedonosporobacter sp.]
MLFWRVLSKRHLALLWSSQVLSAIGDYFYQIAVMWIAIKVAGGAGGIVIAAQSGAALVCGLLGGVYVDRWNRRTTMIAVDVLRGLVVGTLPIMALYGSLQLWYMILVGIVIGGLGALFNPALSASMPALTEDPQTLQASNGLMDVTRRLARALGPSMAGLLVSLIPLKHFFTLDAISFGISALAVLLMGGRFAWQPEYSPTRKGGIGSIIADMAEAVDVIRRHPLISWMMVGMGVINGAWSAAFVVGAPLFADRVLHGNVGAYGLIVGAYGIGNVASNMIVSNLTIRHRTLTIMLGKIIVGVGFLIMVATPFLPLALLGSALASIGGPMGDMPYLTMMQTELPQQHLGKAFSLDMTIGSLGSLLGILLAAPLYQYLSVPLAIACCSLLIVGVGVSGLWRFGITGPEQKTAVEQGMPE